VLCDGSASLGHAMGVGVGLRGWPGPGGCGRADGVRKVRRVRQHKGPFHRNVEQGEILDASHGGGVAFGNVDHCVAAV